MLNKDKTDIEDTEAEELEEVLIPGLVSAKERSIGTSEFAGVTWDKFTRELSNEDKLKIQSLFPAIREYDFNDPGDLSEMLENAREAAARERELHKEYYEETGDFVD